MSRRKLWKGAIAGGAAGLAGTIAMTQFQTLWGKATEKLTKNGKAAQGEERSPTESEDATMKAAAKMAELAGRRLSREEKQKAAAFVHYGSGTTMGVIYGTLMELGPRDLRRHELLSGIGFGSVLYAGTDEIAVPAAGLRAAQPDADLYPSHGSGFPRRMWFDHRGRCARRCGRHCKKNPLATRAS